MSTVKRSVGRVDGVPVQRLGRRLDFCLESGEPLRGSICGICRGFVFSGSLVWVSGGETLVKAVKGFFRSTQLLLRKRMAKAGPKDKGKGPGKGKRTPGSQKEASKEPEIVPSDDDDSESDAEEL